MPERKCRRFRIAALASALLLAGCYSEKPPDTREPTINRDALKLYHEALDLLAQGDDLLALDKLDQSIQADPSFPPLYSRKAGVLARLERYAEAAQAVEKHVELDPRNAEAHLLLGLLVEESRGPGEARPYYKQAVDLLDPNEAMRAGDARRAIYRAVAIYLAQGRLDGVRAINEVINAYPAQQTARLLKQRMKQEERGYFLWWLSRPPEEDAPYREATETQEQRRTAVGR